MLWGPMSDPSEREKNKRPRNVEVTLGKSKLRPATDKK